MNLNKIRKFLKNIGSNKTKIRKSITTYDPDIKLSRWKIFQIKSKNRREKIRQAIKTNQKIIFFKDMVGDILIYSSLCVCISLPLFYFHPLVIGLSLGAGIWLYINRLHSKIKEILGAINLVNNIRYGK